MKDKRIRNALDLRSQTAIYKHSSGQGWQIPGSEVAAGTHYFGKEMLALNVTNARNTDSGIKLTEGTKESFSNVLAVLHEDVSRIYFLSRSNTACYMK